MSLEDVRAAIADLRDENGTLYVVADEVANVVEEGDWVGITLGLEPSARDRTS